LAAALAGALAGAFVPDEDLAELVLEPEGVDVAFMVVQL
jgi:hypothetical protein